MLFEAQVGVESIIVHMEKKSTWEAQRFSINCPDNVYVSEFCLAIVQNKLIKYSNHKISAYTQYYSSIMPKTHEYKCASIKIILSRKVYIHKKNILYNK